MLRFARMTTKNKANGVSAYWLTLGLNDKCLGITYPTPTISEALAGDNVITITCTNAGATPGRVKYDTTYSVPNSWADTSVVIPLVGSPATVTIYNRRGNLATEAVI